MEITKLIGILGGWSILAIGLLAWINKLSTERVLSQWRRDEKAATEKLRDELTLNRSMVELATKSHAAGQDIFQRKRAEAVEQLWIATLELRKRLWAPVFFFGVLLPAEYDNAFGNERVGAFIASLTEEELLQAMDPTAVLEQHRPYLGEMLWLRFWVYRAFLGRLTHIILDGKRRKHIQDWRADQGVQQILEHVTPDNVRRRILVDEPAVTAVNIAVNTLEGLILEEISLIMSGRR